MSVLDDFRDLLPNNVVIENFVSRDRYGSATYGAPVTVQGRLVKKAKLVRAIDGREAVSSSFVRIPPVAGLNENSRVSVDGVSRPVLAVESAPDETGADYYALVRFQ